MEMQAFSEATYKHMFGLRKKRELEFADGLVTGLQKIDRGLLAPASPHPYREQINQGEAGVDALVTVVENEAGQAQFDAIDALSHIFLYDPVSADMSRRLRKVLNRAGVSEGDEELVAAIAKALAIGQDEELLRRQVSLLADDDPGIVATAARLLGFGRYRAAVPLLNALVSPDRFYESRYVIWALGEIGDDAALPILGYALASGYRTIDCMVAMGKIGDISSIPKLTPMIIDGLPDQRDAAYRAMAMVFEKNRTFLASLAHTRQEFSTLILGQLTKGDIELSGSTRFHMLLCLARLGEKLDVPRVKTFLKLPLEEDEASELQAFFTKR